METALRVEDKAKTCLMVYVSQSTYDGLRKEAFIRDVKMSGLLNQILESYLVTGGDVSGYSIDNDKRKISDSDYERPEFVVTLGNDGKPERKQRLVGRRKIGVNLTVENYDVAKAIAREHGISVSDFMRQLCESFLKTQAKKDIREQETNSEFKMLIDLG